MQRAMIFAFIAVAGAPFIGIWRDTSGQNPMARSWPRGGRRQQARAAQKRVEASSRLVSGSLRFQWSARDAEELSELSLLARPRDKFSRLDGALRLRTQMTPTEMGLTRSILRKKTPAVCPTQAPASQ